MRYSVTAIPESEVPPAVSPACQHALDTYASETNKVYATWLQFSDTDLDFKPHARSSDVRGVMKHQLLSERRFFAEFLQLPEPPANQVLPKESSVAAYSQRLVGLARPRLAFLARQHDLWWLGLSRFFDVDRQRVWIFWRRILHTAHHRTQLTVYLRLLDKPVPAIYGPTADVVWEGADPTTTAEAAGRVATTAASPDPPAEDPGAGCCPR